MKTRNKDGGLFCTRDYKKFALHEYNREFHEDDSLLTSMKEHGFLMSSPIHCAVNGDGRLKIIRGHHRFKYAQQLGLPIYYVIDNTECDIFELEGSTKSRWSARDFAFARKRAGISEYKELLDFQDKHGIPLGAAADLLSGLTAGTGASSLKQVKRGEFKIGDLTHANRVLSITDILRGPGREFSKSSSFIKAVSHILRIPELDFKLFTQKIKDRGGDLMKRATCEGYIDDMEKIYNIRNKNPIYFSVRSKEVARNRQRTFGRES